MYTKSGGYMEDREKSKATESENIIDLTPDMEVTEESRIEIIDLTDIVDGPDEIPSIAAPVDETPPAAEKPAFRPPRGSALSSAIEQQVEAAFDFVASPIQDETPHEEPSADHEGLMDKLSDIPRIVDDALDASGTPGTGKDAAVDEPEPQAHAQGTDTADRTGFSLDEEEDQIIELTDIVDPSELEAAYLENRDDEEIIELTDIVDSSELVAAGLKMDDDDEIIELTDIVDPAELRVDAVTPEPDETGSEPTASAAIADETADAGLGDEEYEDLLEMIDTLDADELLVDIAEEESWEPETIPVDQAADTTVAAEDTAPVEPGDVPDEDQEYAELLDTIDSLDPEDLLVSVDEAGLFDTGEDAGPVADQAEPEEEEEGLLSLTDVLNRSAADAAKKPPVERVGSVIREVEEDTGKDVRTLTDNEVEAAVERILKTKYAETIERLIANAVEKAVNREIENLKRTMLDDD
jgi:hypothetical protein